MLLMLSTGITCMYLTCLSKYAPLVLQCRTTAWHVPEQVVVVRDDILSRWGQSKLAVMISSCILGLYKRNYKNRELRASLLTWVSSCSCGHLAAVTNSKQLDTSAQNVVLLLLP